MLIEEKIDIKVIPCNKQHYEELGHNCNNGDIITISTAELPRKSKKKESRICDYCGKVYIREHASNVVTFNAWGQDLCPMCLKSDHFKKIKSQKVKATNLVKYGVEVPLQNSEVRAKQQETMKERYGVEFAAQSSVFLKKMGETNLERYGSVNAMNNPIIKESVRTSLYKNGTVPTSTQQVELYRMIQSLYKNSQVELNYPESTTSLDIFLQYNDLKIDIEYDGSFWHQDQQKDRRRDEFLKARGYKILRIRSGHLLPTEEQLVEAITKLINDDYTFTEIKLQDFNNI